MTVPAKIDRRFREAAANEGLLDVGFDVVDSPVGALLLAATPRGVCRISYDADPEAQAERLARVYGPRVLRAPRAVDGAKRELDEYFDGRREAFDVSVDLTGAAEFTRDVLRELAQVPFGEVTTYGQLAARVGRPRAARAVGTVMNRNPIPIVLPCHRVVGSTGSLVGYAGGLDRKEQLLRLEGARL
ncbi:MAG TPA: methylated-DNA--[protein]-cysteine S-methyltransferase [Gaiellaceae bacterium]|nr:methylated-DNA--[protein]-cysteine S-methyltransferase [Gaiellaceae bacterium]